MLRLEVLVLIVSCLTLTRGYEHLNSTSLEGSAGETRAIAGQAIPLPTGGFLLIFGNSSVSPEARPAPETPTDELSPHRIVGGQRIPITQSPWTVAIIRNGILSCGGSVVRPRWVLTAGHCVDDGGRLVIRAGTRWFRSGGQTRRVDRIVVHSRYNPRTLENDIALIKVNADFRYSRFVRPVFLPSLDQPLPRAFWATGWGTMAELQDVASRWLRRVQVYPVSRAVCASDYRGRERITQNMICAEADHRDTCSGDSGGPLEWNRRQYGIVSFGFGCGRRFFPGVYTDVRKYRSFILSVVDRN